MWPLQFKPQEPQGDVRAAFRTKHPKDAQSATGGKSAASGWKPVDDRIRRGRVDEDGYAYAEFAYFHPYVQELIYGEENTSHPFDLYQYQQNPAARLILRVKDKNLDALFQVRSIFLHVMEMGVAILSIDLIAQERVSWAAAMDAISYLRISAFPHFKQDEGIWVGGGALERIWFENLPEDPLITKVDPAKELQIAIEQKQSPILHHWRALLRTALPEGVEVRTLGDHRMATMAFLCLPDPENLSDDDWFALSEADGSDFIPYAEAFRERELSKAVYDRWWDKKVPEHNQRWLAGARTFIQVKGIPDGDPPPYIKRMQETFRRQWYQIFLLAHLQRSVLLSFQGRVAAAASDLQLLSQESASKDRTLDKIEQMQRDLAVFSSRFWFHEVTAQVQGAELYALLKDRLQLDRLYHEVMDDKALLVDVITTLIERRREAELGALNRIGSFFIPLSLVFSFLGINYVLPQFSNYMGSVSTRFTASPQLWTEVIVTVVLVSLAIWYGRRLVKRSRSST